MQGYLGQIASRSDSLTPGVWVKPPSARMPEVENRLIDPFEQDAGEEARLSPPEETPAASTVSITQQDSPSNPTSAIVSKVVTEVRTGVSYLQTHVTRIREQSHHQPGVKDTNRSMAADANADHAGEIEVKTIQQEAANAHKDDGSRTTFLLNPVANDITDVKLQQPAPTLHQYMLKAIPHQKEQSALSPVVDQDKKYNSEKRISSRPSLVIGRITVEILPPEKPRVIEKVETRTVIAAKPSPIQGNNKFIFGLGQL